MVLLSFSMIFLKMHVTQSWTSLPIPTSPLLLSSVTHLHPILLHSVSLERMTFHFLRRIPLAQDEQLEHLKAETNEEKGLLKHYPVTSDYLRPWAMVKLQQKTSNFYLICWKAKKTFPLPGCSLLFIFFQVSLMDKS